MHPFYFYADIPTIDRYYSYQFIPSSPASGLWIKKKPFYRRRRTPTFKIMNTLRAQFDRARAVSTAAKAMLPATQKQLAPSVDTSLAAPEETSVVHQAQDAINLQEQKEKDEGFYMGEMVRMRKLITTRESEIEAYRQRVVTDMDSLQTEIDLLEESRLEYKKNATLNAASPVGNGDSGTMVNRNNVGDDVSLQFHKS